ncbi:helix-turn-helix domain-containing protein [Tenacibaculum sp. 190524A02b]|uniref:helix-turn-helix domain-containing protein n=1 Tax=Tenacibaculum vairaonense TaxID=3137860 RepID=UPI0031FAF729
MNDKVTSDEIKLIRKNLGINQTELGDLLGVSMRTIQNWEGGKRNIPDWVHIQIRNLGAKEERIGNDDEVVLDVSDKSVLTLDEIALFAAQNMKALKQKSIFYNTFVMEALSLLKEVQNEDGSIDPVKLTSKK